jgi:hypothetical protein
MKFQFLGLLYVLSSLLSAASYQVPVPFDLTDYSRWASIEATAKLENSQLSVTYQLPSELVGKNAPPISFTGKVADNFSEVTGKHVRGYCMISEDKPLTCLLHYPQSIVNENAQDEALKAAYKGTELDFRTKVARLFSADPAGLLMVSF